MTRTRGQRDSRPKTRSWKGVQARPSQFNDYGLYLQRLYDERKEQDSSYTFTDLSTDLGFSATGFVHQIIRRRRPLTAESATRVARAIGLDTEERRYLLALVDFAHAATSEERLHAFESMASIKARISTKTISSDHLEYVSRWYHPVIRELLAIPTLDQSPAALASRTVPSITPADAKASTELLERLGFVARDPSTGRLVPVDSAVTTNAETADVIFARYHATILELAKDAILRTEQDTRCINSATFRLRRDQLDRLKSVVHDFLMRVIATEEPTASSDAIFQLNVQLFPVALGFGSPTTRDGKESA